MQTLCKQYSSEAAARKLGLHMWFESVESLCRQEEFGRSNTENDLVRLDLICLSSLLAYWAAENRLEMHLLIFFSLLNGM